MTAATALCTPNNVFYQRVLVINRSSLPTALHRNNQSVIHPRSSLTNICRSTDFQRKSDENNNHRTLKTNIEEILLITSDEDDDLADEEEPVEKRKQIETKLTSTQIDQDIFLSFVGLRAKTKKIGKILPTMKTLTKRWANPICLLPLPKNYERVRQALYSLMPFLKFIRITNDFERFCSTDSTSKARNIFSRSSIRSRTSANALKKVENKRKSNKSTLNNRKRERRRSNANNRNYLDDYPHSILQCQVSLDRLEESTINELIKSSIEESINSIETMSTQDEQIPSSTQRFKRKLTNDQPIQSKRLKSNEKNDSIMENDEDSNELSSSLYKRIYLKCFVCSKRQHIDSEQINSNVLHSHWLEHGEHLFLNIYDSEIDSILTRVVEFFRPPKRHTLEGRLKTVFMLNSEEIRRLSSNESSTSDEFLIID